MIQRAFPNLSNFPSGRIEFLAPEDKDAKVENVNAWSRILDETWDRFKYASPDRLKVQIADGPGDEDRRESLVCQGYFWIETDDFPRSGIRREKRNNILIMLAVFSPFILMFSVIPILFYSGIIE